MADPPSADDRPVSVEICIVGYRSESVIAHAVSSVSVVPHVSVAVCDNAPTPTSIEPAATAAAAIGVPLRSITAPHNPGFAASCNALAAGSTADWLVFLNPDATIDNWPFGPSGPPCGHLIGAEQRSSSGVALGAYGTGFTVGEEIRRSWLRRPSPRPVGRGFVGGGALAVTRTQFAELGGFDTRYFMFYEDIDLGLRASAAGLSVVVEPAWTVTHDLGHSARKDLRVALMASYTSGRLFHSTYRHNLRAYDLYVAADALLRIGMHVLRRSRRHVRAYGAVARSAAVNAMLPPNRRNGAPS